MNQTRKLRKPLSLLACLLLAALLLAGCGPKLPDTIDSNAVKDTATRVIEDVNARKYEELNLLFPEEFQADLTTEMWSEPLDPILDELGDFTEFKEMQIVSQEVQEVEVVFALASTVYANGTCVWAIQFDVNGNLNGVFINQYKIN